MEKEPDVATQEEQLMALREIEEGDLLEVGILFPGLASDRISWQVVERCEDPKRPGRTRLTFRLYVFGIFWRAAVASVGESEVTWPTVD